MHWPQLVLSANNQVITEDAKVNKQAKSINYFKLSEFRLKNVSDTFTRANIELLNCIKLWSQWIIKFNIIFALLKKEEGSGRGRWSRRRIKRREREKRCIVNFFFNVIVNAKWRKQEKNDQSVVVNKKAYIKWTQTLKKCMLNIKEHGRSTNKHT